MATTILSFITFLGGTSGLAYYFDISRFKQLLVLVTFVGPVFYLYYNRLVDRAQLFNDLQDANKLKDKQAKQIDELKQKNKALEDSVTTLKSLQSAWKPQPDNQFIAPASNLTSVSGFRHRETTTYDSNLNKTSTH